MRNSKEPAKKKERITWHESVLFIMFYLLFGVLGFILGIASYYVLKQLWKKQIVYKPHGKTEIADRDG